MYGWREARVNTRDYSHENPNRGWVSEMERKACNVLKEWMLVSRLVMPHSESNGLQLRPNMIDEEMLKQCWRRATWLYGKCETATRCITTLPSRMGYAAAQRYVAEIGLLSALLYACFIGSSGVWRIRLHAWIGPKETQIFNIPLSRKSMLSVLVWWIGPQAQCQILQ